MKHPVLLSLIIFLLPTIVKSLTLPHTSLGTRTQIPECFYRLYPVDDGHLETAYTRVWLSYDEQALHVHIETPWEDDFLTGTPSRRDEGTNAEMVTLKLVTNANSRLGYGFNFYPQGNLCDYSLEGLSQKNDWDGGYTYQSDIVGHTWAIEASIPFASLRLPGQAPFNFKVVLTRLYNQDSETYICPRLNQKDDDEIYTAGLDFVVPTAVQTNPLVLKFKPYITRQYDIINKTQTYDPDHVGVDVNLSVNSDTQVKIALRPDFSDIPQDDVINVYNMKDSPTYDENRYFFKDDIYILNLPQLMLYTRNINQPDAAGRITYSGSDSQFGYLIAHDKKISQNGYIRFYDDTYQALAYTRTTFEHTVKYGLTTRTNDDFLSLMQMARDEWRLTPDQTMYITAYHSFNDPRDDQKTANQQHGFGSEAEYLLNIPNWKADLSTLWYNKYLLSQAGTMNPDFGHDYNNYLWPSGSITYYRNYDEHFLKNWSIKLAGSYSDYFAKNSANPWWGGTTLDVNADKTKLELFYSHGEDAIVDQSFSSDMFSVDYSRTRLAWLNWTCGWLITKSVVYSRAKVFTIRRYSVGASGNVARFVTYSLDGRLYDLVLNPDQRFSDNQYMLFNGKITFNATSTLMLRLGATLDTYQTAYQTDQFGFYGNFSWEFQPECTLYLGYSTSRYQEEEQVEDLDLTHFKSDYQTAYVKVGYTF